MNFIQRLVSKNEAMRAFLNFLKLSLNYVLFFVRFFRYSLVIRLVNENILKPFDFNDLNEIKKIKIRGNILKFVNPEYFLSCSFAEQFQKFKI